VEARYRAHTLTRSRYARCPLPGGRGAEKEGGLITTPLPQGEGSARVARAGEGEGEGALRVSVNKPQSNAPNGYNLGALARLAAVL